MGYNSWVEGEITVTPPLTWKQIRAISLHDIEPLELVISQEITETDDGTTTVKTCTLIEPETEDKIRNADRIVWALERIVDEAPGNTFSGEFVVTSAEEPVPPYRVRVTSTMAVRREEAVLTWPTEETDV